VEDLSVLGDGFPLSPGSTVSGNLFPPSTP
jgi:hypothetical protein